MDAWLVEPALHEQTHNELISIVTDGLNTTRVSIIGNFERPTSRGRIVKNELGGSATQQELKSWGGWGGHNGMNRGTGGVEPPQPPRQFEPCPQVMMIESCCSVAVLHVRSGRAGFQIPFRESMCNVALVGISISQLRSSPCHR